MVEPVLVDGLVEVGDVTAEGTVVPVVVSEPTVPSVWLSVLVTVVAAVPAVWVTVLTAVVTSWLRGLGVLPGGEEGGGGGGGGVCERGCAGAACVVVDVGVGFVDGVSEIVGAETLGATVAARAGTAGWEDALTGTVRGAGMAIGALYAACSVESGSCIPGRPCTCMALP